MTIDQDFYLKIKEENDNGKLEGTDYGHALKALGTHIRDGLDEHEIEINQEFIKIYNQFGDKILSHLPEKAREIIKNSVIANE